MAKAAVEVAESRYDFCWRESQRNEALQTTNVSRSAVDASQSELLQAKAKLTEATEALRLMQLGPRPERIAASAAELERAQARLRKAEYYCRSTEITAPIGGVLIDVAIEEGESVSPELHGSGIFTIAEVGTFIVEIDIAERDLAAVCIGQPCLITTETHPDDSYRGRLDWLAPTINRQRGIRHAQISLVHQDNRLVPDMNCRVRIYASSTDQRPPTETSSALPLTHNYTRTSHDQGST